MSPKEARFARNYSLHTLHKLHYNNHCIIYACKCDVCKPTLHAVAIVRDQEFCSEINHFVSYSGFTPLHYAVVMDDKRMVHLLLEHGADPTVENNRGLPPINYCTNDAIQTLLEEYTAKVWAVLSMLVYGAALGMLVYEWDNTGHVSVWGSTEHVSVWGSTGHVSVWGSTEHVSVWGSTEHVSVCMGEY